MIFTNTDQIITINQRILATIKILNDEDFLYVGIKIMVNKNDLKLVH